MRGTAVLSAFGVCFLWQSSFYCTVRLSSLKQFCIRVMVWKKHQGEVGVEDTYVHGDVNYPLWHRLVEQHGLRLPSGIPAQQPGHSHQVVSDTTAR